MRFGATIRAGSRRIVPAVAAAIASDGQRSGPTCVGGDIAGRIRGRHRESVSNSHSPPA